MGEPITPPGHFGWNELLTHDAKAAAEFYSGVFGWQVSEMDMGDHGTYSMFKDGDILVGGMVEITDQMPEAQPGWMSYVNVADLDESIAQVGAGGGTVAMGPQEVPGMGRFAVIIDPGGAVFSLWQSTGNEDCPTGE